MATKKDVKYGTIYRFIGPDGDYIGQTKQHVMNRVNQHKNCAMSNDSRHCYLHDAIRQHGWKAFKFKIVMHECEVSLLNYWEKYYIKHYNTLYPNGYNSTSGGSRTTEYSDLTKLKCSDSTRRRASFYELTHDLPLGIMIHTDNGAPIGFTVNASKKLPQAKFWDKSKGLEENRRLALEYVKNGKKQEKELPRFIEKTKKGYIMNYRLYTGGKTIRYGYKRFESREFSSQENLNMAIAELNKIKELYKV